MHVPFEEEGSGFRTGLDRRETKRIREAGKLTITPILRGFAPSSTTNERYQQCKVRKRQRKEAQASKSNNRNARDILNPTQSAARMNQRDAVGHPNGVCGHLCLWGRISVLVASVCEFRPTAPYQPTYNHIPDLPGRGFDARSVTGGRTAWWSASTPGAGTSGAVGFSKTTSPPGATLPRRTHTFSFLPPERTWETSQRWSIEVARSVVLAWSMVSTKPLFVRTHLSAPVALRVATQSILRFSYQIVGQKVEQASLASGIDREASYTNQL